MPVVVVYTLSKISIKNLTARFPFPETFCLYPLHITLRFIWLYLFIEFFIGKFVELYFIFFQSSLLVKFLRSSDVKNWSNDYLKELYRFQITFENAPIYIGGALQRVINYLSNFSAFSSSICGDRCNEIWLRFPYGI